MSFILSVSLVFTFPTVCMLYYQCFDRPLSSVTAEFDHQLVRSAPLVLSSPLQFQPLLSVIVQLQSVPGVPGARGGSGGDDGGVGRHGVGREAVRLRPMQLRLQARQLPAQPQAHPQDWRLQVGTAPSLHQQSKLLGYVRKDALPASI